MPQSTLEKSVTKSCHGVDSENFEYDIDKVSNSSIDWGDFYPKQIGDLLLRYENIIKRQ